MADGDVDREKHTDSPLRELNRTFKRSMSIEGSPMIFACKRPDRSHTPNASFKRMSFDFTEYSAEQLQGLLNTATMPITEGKVLVITADSDDHGLNEHSQENIHHQENARRTQVLTGELGCLRRKELEKSITWISPELVKEASLADLLRVHEYNYLNSLETRAAAHAVRSNRPSNVVSPSIASSAGDPVPRLVLPSPFTTNNMLNGASSDHHNNHFKTQQPSFYAPEGYLDPDTPLSLHSLSAAKKYCGAAMLAVDLLLQSDKNGEGVGFEHQNRAAFVVGRPPGHHAGPNGCVPSEYFWKHPQMASSGFCLLNTVGVAAGYARYKYSSHFNGGSPPRIAIVDIDIHHGNGTEEIVKNLRPHVIHLPLPSSWAPVSQLSYKPWLNAKDADDVMFASLHLLSRKSYILVSSL